MDTITTKLLDAQKYAFSIRPKIGGFPVLAEVLRSAGFLTNRWSLPSCQSIYRTENGSVVQQGEPLVTGVHAIQNFDRDALITAIRKDQEGRSTFSEFLNSAWEAGIISYEVDFTCRKVIYFGANGESYMEDYPSVSIKNN